MWVARQANSGESLLAEVVEVFLSQPPFQEGSGVDTRGGVALKEDLVAGAGVAARRLCVLAFEEVVEAHLVERRSAGVCGQMPADTGRSVVGPEDHCHGIPPNEPPDAPLDILVAGEERLLLGADGVDVAGLGQRRKTDAQLASPLENLEQQEARALIPLLAVDLVEGIEPFPGLGRVDIG